MRRANVAATTLIAAALVLGGTSPAWAHHATPTHTITCESTGTYQVVESVTNSENDKIMTIVTSTGFSPIQNGDTVNQGATRDYTLSGVAAPQDMTVTYAVSWPNGVTSTATDVIHASEFPVCATPSPTPTPTPTPTSTPTPTPVPTPTSTPPVGNPNQPTLPNTGIDERLLRNALGTGLAALVLGGLVTHRAYKRRPRHRA